MTGIPGDQIGPLMRDLVPMVSTLDLEYVDVTPEHAIVRLKDAPEYRNHVGGPHAATMFLVAESATGAVALAVFGDLLERAVLLPVSVTMDFLTVARGDLTATARVDADEEQVRATFESGTRPEFNVVADIANAEGEVTGRMRARWTLRPFRFVVT